MVFAAGLGARLRPLTDRVPKALVPVAGVPMLERVARRLVEAGATRLVVNVCPFADEIEAFVRSRRGFGVETVVSREAPAPLETGGGLLAAAPLLSRTAPFLLHNVDVVTDLPLRDLLAAHLRDRPLATLAVMERETSRRLLFDDLGLLGRVDDARGLRALAREPRGRVEELGFAGVHVADPELASLLVERGAFSILDPYLRLVASGRRIAPFRVDGHLWIDVGRPADLERANAALSSPTRPV
jgi:NDP-sugar pyrophosphorylase family protein